MKRLAIYCVTYHSYNELYRFLQSVEEAALRVSSSLTVDVYVADNTDSQIQPVSDSCSACHLKVFQLKHNWGYFGAIQKMLKQTDVTPYDFVVISNVDLIVSVDAFEKLGVDEAEVTMEASFTNDLGADSLDTVELIMEFEKEFGISIPDEAAEKIATVGDAVNYIEANVQA